MRILVLACGYMAASGIWFGVNQLADIDDGSKALAFTILFIALPLIAIIVAAWDGVKEGFSLLWFVAPFVCFLVPMFLFFNVSALYLGGFYAVFGIIANALGAFVRRSSARYRAIVRLTQPRPRRELSWMGVRAGGGALWTVDVWVLVTCCR